jgi:hypothetical protein
MAGVFKSLDKSDVRLTPFRAYKQWSDTISYCNYSASLGTLTNPTLITLSNNGGDLVIATTTNYAILDPTNENLENLSGTTAFADTPVSNIFKHPTDPNQVIVLSNKFGTIDLTTLTYTTQIAYPGTDTAYDTVDNVHVIAYGAGLNQGRIAILDSSYNNQDDIIETIRLNKVSTDAHNLGDDSNYFFLAEDKTGGINNGSYLIAFSYTSPNLTFSYKIQITTETGTQTLLYNSNQQGHYALTNNKLYFIDLATYVVILVATGVTQVLSDTNDKIHAILQNGDILTDVVVSGATVIYDTIQGSSYAGSNTATQAVINSNNEIGILAGNVFYMYNVDTNTFKNPKYIPASIAINKIYSDKDVTTKIYGIGSNILMNLTCEPDDFTLYKADYSGRPYYLTNNPIDINFDQGNGPITGEEILTAEGKYERVVHRSIDHLFYRDYKTNTKATFGGANVNYQRRTLNDRAYILSLPQKKYGEEIQQGSVIIDIKRKGTYYNGDYTLIDDIYGNLYVSNSIGGTQVSSSNEVGRFHFDFGYKYYNKGATTVTDEYADGYWPMKATYKNIIYDRIYSDLGACAYFTASNQSVLVISPGPVQKFKQSYNFENSDFSIFFTLKPQYPTANYEFANLVAKEGSVEDIFIDINGNVGSTPVGTNYPYKIKLCVSGSNQGKLYFSRSSGFQTTEISTGPGDQLSANTVYNIAAVKSGTTMQIYINGFLRATGTDTTTTGTYQSKQCSNESSIFVGANYATSSAYNGYLDNLKFYNKALTSNDLLYLTNTRGVGNRYVGNVFYKHGLVIITDQLVDESDVLTATCRGTQTIYETEVSCTIGGGEFNHSSNPTLQEYEPISDEFIFRPFVSSSDFKPYITTIGLYDDRGNLLVIGKLGQPIKAPNNTDTTFIVRFDR